MTTSSNIKYFLGANAPTGFYSLYEHLISPETAAAIYILKGGPGCGKSTFMRRIAAIAEQHGEPVEQIICSGDPQSLDGIVLPNLRIAFVDGTAPHVVEPKYPGAVEQYINLGEQYDCKTLSTLRQPLFNAMTGYKDCYRRAYRCLAAADEILTDIRATLSTDALEEKAAKRAKGILARECGHIKRSTAGTIKQRFLSAVTYEGHLYLYDTALTQCERIYELSDGYGLSHALLSHLTTGAVTKGLDVVACLDPMSPKRMEHLLIPELSLAFLTVPPKQQLPLKPHRCIRIDSMIDRQLLKRVRPRLRFYKKVSSTLMAEGFDALMQAKQLHDNLEKLYNPHVDFETVEQRALALANDIFAPHNHPNPPLYPEK